MKLTLLLLTIGMLVGCKSNSEVPADRVQADITQANLVGEWVVFGSKFKGGPLSEGAALYIWADGVCAMMVAPPGMGQLGNATYDASQQIVSFAMKDGSRPSMTLEFTHDPKLKTLVSRGEWFGRVPFLHVRNVVPEWVWEERRNAQRMDALNQ
jgi:hypothetical protein